MEQGLFWWSEHCRMEHDRINAYNIGYRIIIVILIAMTSFISSNIITIFSAGLRANAKIAKLFFFSIFLVWSWQCIWFTRQFPHPSHTLRHTLQSCHLSCRGTCSPAGNPLVFYFFFSLFFFFYDQLLSCTPWVVGTQMDGGVPDQGLPHLSLVARHQPLEKCLASSSRGGESASHLSLWNSCYSHHSAHFISLFNTSAVITLFKWQASIQTRAGRAVAGEKEKPQGGFFKLVCSKIIIT